MDLYVLLSLIIIIAIIVSIIAYMLTINYAQYTKKDVISSLEYAINVIDNSYYFERMNILDLKARNADSKQDYIEKYKSAIVAFSNEEKQKLRNLTNEADKVLEDFRVIYSIPWVFVKLNGSVENGYPHTLGDIIFLSDIPSVEVLIHEKIHVYQRMYPIETSKLIHDVWGFDIKDKQERLNNNRNNPDINSFIYGKSDYSIVQLYDTNDPTNISESSTYKMPEHIKINATDIEMPSCIKQVEHPYEMMATLIAQILTQKQCKDQSYVLFNTLSWMQKYF